MARRRSFSTSLFSTSIVMLLLVAVPGATLAQTHLPAPPAPTNGQKSQPKHQTSKPASKSSHNRSSPKSTKSSNNQSSTKSNKPSHNQSPTTSKKSKQQQCPKLPGANGFARAIDNRYMPLVPGTTFTYRETVDGQINNDVVEVTTGTKVIQGVRTVVVHDTSTDAGGDLVEKTTDWYAQDKAGNVWYFGEDTKEYKNGKVVSTKGTWMAGVQGAKPGIVMEAHPKVGDTYRQECAAGQKALDTAKVLDLSTSVTVPFGSFNNALLTQETSRFDPGVVERKQYAPCVGFVRSELAKGGNEVAELVSVTPPPSGSCNQSSVRQSFAPSRSAARNQPSGSGGKAKAPAKGGHHGSSGGGHARHSSAAAGPGGAAGGRGSTRHRHHSSRSGHGRSGGHSSGGPAGR